MLEQDVQLTRLIVEKLTDLDQRKQKVSWQLTEAQERLDKIESLRSQRSAYENVLERAAALLGRDDLKVEIEEPVDDAELAEGLRSELSVLEAEQGQYLELIDELRQRAPALLEAAAGMAPESLQALFVPPSDQEAQAAAAAGEHQAAGSSATEGAAWNSASQTESSNETDAYADADFEADAEPEELDSSPDADLDWTPPAFRPAAMMTEPEMVAESAEAEATEEMASSDSGSGWNWPGSAEDASESATSMAGADSPGSEDDEESVQWPQLGAESEAPSISFEATDWDDQDVEVVSRINYDELASESEQAAKPVSNDHYSNGHYSNGSHSHEVLAESETELAAAADDSATATANEVVTASPGNYGYVALDPEADSETAAHGTSGCESETGEESHALANGAAGFIVEAEQSQSFATVHSELDHSADFRFTPAFAVDSEALLAGAAEHSQVAVDVIESAPDYNSRGAAAEPAAEREEDTRERLIRLARFNHTQLGKRVSGEAPVFVIDATAVLERIPHYDRYHLALDESAARDELVRDFSFLANDLNSAFHLVFNDEHTCGFEVDPHIHLEHGDVNSSDPNPGDQRIQEIVLDYIEHEQPVALVTSDPTLQGLFKGENVVVFSLGEFFLT